ncbi:MAG: S41 family peptidase [Alphaproteobacteria bacterium]|nr:MAG: S41 family peptidase [Alphaproteobacteria bacterium]
MKRLGTKRQRSWTLALALTAAIGLAAVPPLAHHVLAADAAQEGEATFRNLSLLADAFERVQADYVDEIGEEKLTEYALNGMLSSLDPHSAYMNAKAFKDIQTVTRGEFGGLGIEVTMENSIVKVISPLDETPAAKAGLQSGDLITHIDGKLVTELTLSEAVDRMRGPPGTNIKLTVRRGGLSGEPFDVTLTRAIIKVQSVRFRAEDNVGYVRITTFNEQTQPGLEKALNELETSIGSDKLVGYVIDLRNNPGGLLDQAISVSSTFLQPGQEVVSTRSRHKKDNQSATASGGDRTKGRPIVVLINGGSASASEIVAGALKDHHRAIVLGTRSFGKGSVQTIIPLPNSGGAMRLTTARYYTPSGHSIQALGIDPDIVVQPAKLEQIAQSGPGISEADLRGALTNDDKDAVEAARKRRELEEAEAKKNPDKKSETSPSAKPSSGKGDSSANDKADKDKKDASKEDYQLQRALDLLRGVRLFSRPEQPATSAKSAEAAESTDDTKKPAEGGTKKPKI